MEFEKKFFASCIPLFIKTRVKFKETGFQPKIPLLTDTLYRKHVLTMDTL